MNRGKAIEKIVSVGLGTGIKVLNDINRSGRVFRADFIKADGTTRTMVCRCGVRSKSKGVGAKYNFGDKSLVSVWEFGNGYRTIPIDRITAIKHKGVWYDFNYVNSNGRTGLTPGTYNPSSFGLNRRTFKSLTSPLYDN